jgi:hypothetical protein
VVLSAYAIVYNLDETLNSWQVTAAGTNQCRITLWKHTSGDKYRVVCVCLADSSQVSLSVLELMLLKVVVNSYISKDWQYLRTTSSFHQFSKYGFQFASTKEAETFGSSFEPILSKMKDSGMYPKENLVTSLQCRLSPRNALCQQFPQRK